MNNKLEQKFRINSYPLPASERPKEVYEYWVTGRGSFPFDMLRYDSAYPATQEDVRNLDWQLGSQPRSVKLRSYSKPTIERWHSFLWTVSSQKID